MTATLKRTSYINKPGIGFVPFSAIEDEVADLAMAQNLLAVGKSAWEGVTGAKVLEDIEGKVFEVQVAEEGRMRFEVSE